MSLHREPTVGVVTGLVTDANHLLLQGTARNAEHQTEIRIERWDTPITAGAGGDQTTGTWVADSTFANGFVSNTRKKLRSCSTCSEVRADGADLTHAATWESEIRNLKSETSRH
jgi:hypothetical protein